MSKRIQSFFQPVQTKKPKVDEPSEDDSLPRAATAHPSYPFPIPDLPSRIANPLACLESKAPPKSITNHPNLDLLYFAPFLPISIARDLFDFLRQELPFYRVHYTIKRGPTQPQEIKTPRFTTVFGVDETSCFILTPQPNHDHDPDRDHDQQQHAETNTIQSPLTLVDATTHDPIPPTKYQYAPRPIPPCLDALRHRVQEATGNKTTYNFVLVNYYASGDDSIAYHSDDERFLGHNPTIASMSLGDTRDFLMKQKPKPKPGSSSSSSQGANADADADEKPLKFPLGSGDMIIMRGATQANWMHSIPKRKGAVSSRGRINITFRRAVVPGGTNNYYHYNVGSGPFYRWDRERREMALQKQ